jgi:hypothetical protein
MKKWNELSDYLRAQSAEICKENKCNEDGHNCDSYAYITPEGEVIDVCISDYFQGRRGPYAAVSLPWGGTGEELKEEVLDQCAEMEG